MARNTHTLADEDGAYPDWIELHNTSTVGTNLDGWYLTDTPVNLTKWRLPNTNLEANGYLLVFASGKNRVVPGAPLHTSFQLDGNGEYLALVMPDGSTLATEFAPAFPKQYDDIAYGNGESAVVTKLIAGGTPARYVIPTDDTLGTNWAHLSFNDAGWNSGATGIGFASNAAPAATGLFAYWPIREGSGNVVSNLVPGGANGAINSATWVTNDPLRGTVLSFDGTSSYVSAGTIPRLAQSSSNFTWSFWHTQRSVPNANAVVLGNRSGGSQSPLQFVKFTPSNFEYYRGGHIGTMAYGIPGGQWLHLAVVKNGSWLTYFSSGSVVGTSTAGGDLEANPFYWGGDPGAPGEFADGLIDDVALWATALTSDQVAALSAGVSPLALSGPGGLVSTDIRAGMLQVNASAYIRMPFTVNDGATFNTLTLRIKYDDGFIAYLNGVEVARRNAAADARWNSGATAEHPDAMAVQFEAIDLSGHLDALENGANVVAIHGLNRSADDSDFLILPELDASTVLGVGERYLGHPTPGEMNDLGFLGLVAETEFSHDHGFYGSPFVVSLTCATPGATLIYTTNGTAPSLTNGVVYTGPVPIARTTVLRAGGFKPGYHPTALGAQTYLFLEDVFAQDGAGLPNAWGNDWRMDRRVVTNVAYAGRIRDDLKSLPVVSLALDPQEFWGPSGIYTRATSQGVNYERPGSAELFFPDGSRKGFQINCGLRIAGGASRSMTPKHGLRLLFKTQYGASKLNFRFFEDTEVDQFDSIAFRPNFNMSWVRTDNSGPLNNANADGAERTHAIYARDQFTKESQNAMGQVSAHERFVHLYINGVYWGLYNPCERTDASFAATYFGGVKEDYDAIFSDLSSVSRPVDGDKTAWNTMLTLANQGLASAAAYAEIQKFLEVTNLADYMMLNFYCATVDWPWQNWNAARKRETNAQFRFFVWDAEYTLETPPWVPEDRTGVGTGSGEADSPAPLYHQLRQNAEWRLLFADRARKHFFNGGALTTNQAIPRFLRLCGEIDRAIVGESARWGDVVRTSQPYTRDVEWLTEKNRLLTQFFLQRTALVIQQFRNAGLYPGVEAPSFNQHGGVFTNQFILTMSAPQGSVYFTTNGSDPRQPGGALTAGAMAYAGPIALTNSRIIRARAILTNTWSALNEAVFLEATPPPLRITEIMYRPPGPAPGSTNSPDDFEYVEIKNIGANPFDLAGVHFTAGISLTFSNGVLAPGQFAVVVKNQTQFAARYGPTVSVAGEYLGSLNDGGERIRLEGPLGEVIHDFSYSDGYPLTDGMGFSLVIVDDRGPLEQWTRKSGWRTSTTLNGSPGADDPAPSLPPILVNELLTHVDPPLVDAIELFNPTASPVDLGGWFITDDGRLPMKYRIPEGTLIEADGYRVFTGVDFNPTPGVGSSFSFSSLGDEAWLLSGDANTNLTGYLHGFRFGAAENGVTFGRYINSIGDEQFPAQIATTLGFTNSGPCVGPVVINEIMYRPAWGQDEFLELKNITATNVPLFDPRYPTNTWKLAGLAYELPADTTLPAGGLLLLTRLDPAFFRAKYGVPADVQIAGPVPGSLQDHGENLELQRPDTPHTNGVPYITVDAVRYSQQAPWPAAADGGGASLQRLRPTAYGNDPVNWLASSPSAGLDNYPNQPPAVTLLSPADNSVFTSPTSIRIEAAAADADGTVGRVEFFVDGAKLGEATSAPYVFLWQNPDVGPHTLTATATDNAFATAVSSPVTISVVPMVAVPELTIVPAGKNLTLSWPAALTGYVLESANQLPCTAWSPVSGVVSNTLTVTPDTTRFYRLRKN